VNKEPGTKTTIHHMCVLFGLFEMQYNLLLDMLSFKMDTGKNRNITSKD
jgi:hypothetical protein